MTDNKSTDDVQSCQTAVTGSSGLFKMKINKIEIKVIIPTIIIFKNFVNFHWWCYEIVLFEK